MSVCESQMVDCAADSQVSGHYLPHRAPSLCWACGAPWWRYRATPSCRPAHGDLCNSGIFWGKPGGSSPGSNTSDHEERSGNWNIRQVDDWFNWKDKQNSRYLRFVSRAKYKASLIMSAPTGWGKNKVWHRPYIRLWTVLFQNVLFFISTSPLTPRVPCFRDSSKEKV